jgi:pimeloyl-ACP methyl ester carboxylesterase
MAVIERAGHLSNLERPQAFNRVLAAFLSRAAGA